LNALLYGFLFGAIVIPCNPAFIAAFFARAFLIDSFFSSMANFVLFGFGLGFPLLAFSLLSANWSQQIIGWLTKHKRKINFIAGIFMLWISIYYLTSVFKIFSLGFFSDFISSATLVILGVFSSSVPTVSGGGLLASFFLGLLTPLTAVCVLPLYPAFLAYLTNQFSSEVQGQKEESQIQGEQKSIINSSI
jgi:cytochrome c biogenesis protein CcdA